MLTASLTVCRAKAQLLRLEFGLAIAAAATLLAARCAATTVGTILSGVVGVGAGFGRRHGGQRREHEGCPEGECNEKLHEIWDPNGRTLARWRVSRLIDHQ